MAEKKLSFAIITILEKNLRRKKLLIIISTLLLISCSKKEVTSDITTVCDFLSENSGKEYSVVTADIINSSVTPPKPTNCQPKTPDSDCLQRKQEGWTYSTIETDDVPPEMLTSPDSLIIVYTPSENRKKLLDKGLYFTPGDKYQFCARGPFQSYSGRNIFFRVDHLDTIKQIK